MFSKIFSFALILLAIAFQVQAHAAIAPALGVSGNPKRSDAKRPSNSSPCGQGVNIAGQINQSTAINAAADGSFTATVTNFNGGQDGSRQVSGTVNASGQGNNFAGKLQITKNGNGNPSNVGSEQITARLPAGTKCAGGQSRDLCLVSFKTSAGFGNCVVVKQARANKRTISGSRLPRALVHKVEEAAGVAKRGVLSWVWA